MERQRNKIIFTSDEQTVSTVPPSARVEEATDLLERVLEDRECSKDEFEVLLECDYDGLDPYGRHRLTQLYEELYSLTGMAIELGALAAPQIVEGLINEANRSG